MSFSGHIKNLKLPQILLFIFAVIFFAGPQSILASFFQSSSISVKIVGIDNSQITSEFTSQSKLEKYKDKKIDSSRWLGKLIEDDKEALLKVLKSYGRYGARITTKQNTANEQTSVVFHVEDTEQYSFQKVKVNFEGRETYNLQLRKDMTKDAFNLKGQKVNASTLYAKFSNFVNKAGEMGFPFAKVVDHCATVNHQTKTVDLVIEIFLGERVAFGRIEISGAPTVPHEYIKNRAPWCDNGMFQRSKLNKYQDILYQTELFNRVSITANEDQIKNHKIQIDVDTKESKKRTVYGGAEYSLSDGVGAKVGWEHRNLTGQADKLSPSLKLSQREQKATLEYMLPDFWRVNTSLHSSLEARQRDTKAFDEKGIYGSLSFQTRLDEHITYFYGFSLEGAKIKKSGRHQDNTIMGVPVGINVTHVNNMLDPTKGFKFSATVNPEVGVLESDQLLTKLVLSASHYLPLSQETTWANRARAGTIIGLSDKVIPADRRFYAGGGGSVRAYGYQLAGPLDRQNKPRGGRTLLEGSSEVRQRIFDDWGVVAFIDAAYVEPKNIPDFKKDLFYGVGAGIRYYTDFGPIRLDVAVPLRKNKDSFGKNINRPIQFYVSIGQSF